MVKALRFDVSSRRWLSSLELTHIYMYIMCIYLVWGKIASLWWTLDVIKHYFVASEAVVAIVARGDSKKQKKKKKQNSVNDSNIRRCRREQRKEWSVYCINGKLRWATVLYMFDVDEMERIFFLNEKILVD